ncbi:hypothetical protein ACELLULO517_07790 [Acidisoma cellulosilytica]|uniref:Uncharacterized protein n=1 Tax=Acidisoma cellulosilyticum TaxID=2802395 RepID=A0A963Z1K1_9PROT|nr:hypothetical protein [Acidisoma cellulosilyticum]MCB8880133.1 hypothetical protein [Acidisoma cellulosilyticum]
MASGPSGNGLSGSGLSTVETLLRQLIQAVNGLGTVISKGSSTSTTTALSTNSPTATAGAATLPVGPVGFITFTDTSGTVRKIPYYGD